MPLPPTDQSTGLPDQHLRDAYRRADYTVNGQRLKIGQPHPEFDRWLAELGHSSYTILTAYNPLSTPLPQVVNAARHRTLTALVDQLRYAHVVASGSDPAGHWPDEHGLCLFDLPEEKSIHLARLYEQHAIVVGGLGRTPRLLYP
ncbi:hypothetical protein LEM8419_00962 [Neolewinella maritima]|uniref:DUF3293 domain-containing protein n=1 Tax=Neolewinella maritima TaxID=1383882 RepID=A0ABM9AYI5_9BACT|nr:DUF3293 domain-containing protein [Neolewinella maritima]CAH0999662.1 hypothetical protein LEM8419_00962 [Neolewinella maritima]